MMPVRLPAARAYRREAPPSKNHTPAPCPPRYAVLRLLATLPVFLGHRIPPPRANLQSGRKPPAPLPFFPISLPKPQPPLSASTPPAENSRAPLQSMLFRIFRSLRPRRHDASIA